MDSLCAASKSLPLEIQSTTLCLGKAKVPCAKAPSFQSLNDQTEYPYSIVGRTCSWLMANDDGQQADAVVGLKVHTMASALTLPNLALFCGPCHCGTNFIRPRCRLVYFYRYSGTLGTRKVLLLATAMLFHHNPTATCPTYVVESGLTFTILSTCYSRQTNPVFESSKSTLPVAIHSFLLGHIAERCAAQNCR